MDSQGISQPALTNEDTNQLLLTQVSPLKKNAVTSPKLDHLLA